jgi:hypothetical protein
MADNDYDPAGSTQMFRAFVDDGTTTAPQRRSSSGGRTGLIAVAVVIAIAVVAAVVWLAVK